MRLAPYQPGPSQWIAKEGQMNQVPDERLDVLFISEDSDLAEMYRLKLELDGYLVRTVRRDEEWPPAGWRPDIAYLDVDGGEGLGLRGYSRLRSDAAMGDVPVVILARVGAFDLARRGFILGAQDYLVTVNEPYQLSPTLEHLSDGLEAIPAAALE